MQSYVVLAVILAIFVRVPRWPCETPEPWPGTHIVFLYPFSATKGGRTFGIVGTVLLLFGYTAIVYFGYAKPWAKATQKAAENRDGNEQGRNSVAPPGAPAISPAPSTTAIRAPTAPAGARPYDPAVAQPGPDLDPQYKVARLDGRVLVTSIIILLVTALAVANTKLLRRWNHAPAGPDVDWEFGQFLALALAALPGWQTARAFLTYGFGPRPESNRHRGLRLRRERARGSSAVGRGAAPHGRSLIGRVLGVMPPSALPPLAPPAPEPSGNDGDDDCSDSNSTDSESNPVATGAGPPVIELRHLSNGRS
jgi:hypothetical protein